MVDLPYGRQFVDEDDVADVVAVLRGDFLTTGPAVARFEQALCTETGAAFATVVNSGTAALHCAYAAAGITTGDVLVTSPITFASTANAARQLGATIRFADVDARTGNIDPDAARQAIGRGRTFICAVDFAGHPAEYDRLRSLGATALIADAAHSLGGSYQGKRVGTLADLTTFSFHPVKAITTGEGGAVMCDRPDLSARAVAFRSHGIVRDSADMRSCEGGWWYEQQTLGANYRLTDIQCALGCSQMRKLAKFLARRRDIVGRYTAAFSATSLRLPIELEGVTSAWHLYVIRLPDPTRRKAMYDLLRSQGIGVQVHYLPVYWHPYYSDLGYRRGLCPVAEDFYARSLSLPLFPAMTDADVDRVIDHVLAAAKHLI